MRSKLTLTVLEMPIYYGNRTCKEAHKTQVQWQLIRAGARCARDPPEPAATAKRSGRKRLDIIPSHRN